MDALLEAEGVPVRETVGASKERLGPEDVLALAREAGRIIVAKGKNVVTFDMDNDPPDDETLLRHLLGPSRNLRAPTARRGDTLFVGCNEAEFRPLLAGK